MRRRLLLTCVAAIGLAWGAADEEGIWREYVAWYRTQPVSVSDPRGAYVDHLKRSGVADAEAQQRSKIIERLSRERREELYPFFFDRTYSSPTPGWSKPFGMSRPDARSTSTWDKGGMPFSSR